MQDFTVVRILASREGDMQLELERERERERERETVFLGGHERLSSKSSRASC